MSDKNYAPVVLFVYNRADHLEKTYQALSQCPEAAETDLYIFSDGWKNEQGREKVQMVRDALRLIEQKKDFRSVTVTESPVNKGLARSIIDGVTKIVNKYGRVAVLEDDSCVSPYYLKFINNCLDFYESDERVGSIAGFTPAIRFPDDFRDDVFFAFRSCSCGWATWKDRWDNISWDLSNIGDFYRDPKLVKKLNSCGADRFIRLYRQTKGNGSSWSVRFGAHLVQHDWMTVYPRYSYISNIGCDESGVHSKSEDAEKMKVDLTKAIAEPDLSDIEYRKDIQKIMKKHYSGGFISDVKRTVATKAIIAKERIRLGK